MYTSKLNIKHNRSAEIHWGLHKLTNEFIWIDDVEGNGYACNCKCACCGSDLKAVTQGKIQQHHFKHRGNNGCYYSDEIAAYLKARHLLSALDSIWIPPVAIRIGRNPQILQTAQEVSIDNVECFHDANHYPPLLLANINGKTTRIILSFGDYYSQADRVLLKSDARENNWDCLEIFLPQRDNSIIISTEQLHTYDSGMNSNKQWIFNSKAYTCFRHLKNISRILAPKYIKYGGITDTEYACPAHKREFNEKFYAFKNDCKECDFRLVFDAESCLCLAEAYIKELSDLDVPENIRRECFLKLQKENEMRIQEQNRKKIEQTSVRLPRKSNTVENNQIASLDSQLVKECFYKQLCPCCGKRLHKQPGKRKNNWLCLNLACEFCVVEDQLTGEIKIIHRGKEVK